MLLREFFALWKKELFYLMVGVTKKMEFNVDFNTDYNIAI